MTPTTSSLHLTTGSFYTTNHPEFLKYKITKVQYAGDFATSNNEYYLFSGLKPNGEQKAINFPKNQVDVGRYDKFFSIIQSETGSLSDES